MDFAVSSGFILEFSEGSDSSGLADDLLEALGDTAFVQTHDLYQKGRFPYDFSVPQYARAFPNTGRGQLVTYYSGELARRMNALYKKTGRIPTFSDYKDAAWALFDREYSFARSLLHGHFYDFYLGERLTNAYLKLAFDAYLPNASKN